MRTILPSSSSSRKTPPRVAGSSDAFASGISTPKLWFVVPLASVWMRTIPTKNRRTPDETIPIRVATVDVGCNIEPLIVLESVAHASSVNSHARRVRPCGVASDLLRDLLRFPLQFTGNVTVKDA